MLFLDKGAVGQVSNLRLNVVSGGEEERGLAGGTQRGNTGLSRAASRGGEGGEVGGDDDMGGASSKQNVTRL